MLRKWFRWRRDRDRDSAGGREADARTGAFRPVDDSGQTLAVRSPDATTVPSVGAGATPPPRTAPAPRTPSPAPEPRPATPSPAPKPPRGDATVAAPGVERPAMVVGVLVVVEGEFLGRAFALFEGANRIGSARGCEVRLPSERISPEQATIECEGDRFVLRGLSDRPTLHNFEATAEAPLADLDSIRVGMTTLRFRPMVRT